MIEELKRIRERPIRLDQGICGNLRTLVGDEKWRETSLHLRGLMDRWPETSGDRFCPVEGSGAAQNPVAEPSSYCLIKELEDG